MALPPFRCKRFLVEQDGAAHPLGTDSMLLGAWADAAQCQRILDIGTGTGMVALMLAQRCEGRAFHIDAVEIDPSSAACARRNFGQSPWAEHIAVYPVAIQQFVPPLPQGYDLIVSNPPFFTETTASPDARRSQARTALALPFPELLEAVLRLLSPGGAFAVVLPLREGYALAEMAACKGLYANALTEVAGKKGKKPERLLALYSRKPHFLYKTHMAIYDVDGKPSPDYRQLTHEFYLGGTPGATSASPAPPQEMI